MQKSTVQTKISDEEKAERENTIAEYEEPLQNDEGINDLLTKPFTKTELSNSQENLDFSPRKGLDFPQNERSSQ